MDKLSIETLTMHTQAMLIASHVSCMAMENASRVDRGLAPAYGEGSFDKVYTYIDDLQKQAVDIRKRLGRAV